MEDIKILFKDLNVSDLNSLINICIISEGFWKKYIVIKDKHSSVIEKRKKNKDKRKKKKNDDYDYDDDFIVDDEDYDDEDLLFDEEEYILKLSTSSSHSRKRNRKARINNIKESDLVYLFPTPDQMAAMIKTKK